MPLRSNLEHHVRTLFASHDGWSKPESEHGPLPPQRNISILELRAYGSQANHYLSVAKDYRAHPGFDKLPDDVKADLDDFIAELEAHKAEVAEATDPERVMRRLHPMEMHNLMAHVLVPEETKKQLLARVQMKKLAARPK